MTSRAVFVIIRDSSHWAVPAPEELCILWPSLRPVTHFWTQPCGRLTPRLYVGFLVISYRRPEEREGTSRPAELSGWP